jgi:hypothetical protein
VIDSGDKAKVDEERLDPNRPTHSKRINEVFRVKRNLLIDQLTLH